ncbi:hypothetical protein K458DRAFT_243114, partial [Lentithecium fluviatile CBS 122367]
PWFVSPIKAWNEELGSFSPRHEASILELFFDLFFVANLATFTQYHAITSMYNFWSYVAFFFVLWTTWFHVVCFDARFAADSVWERTCKALHFCVFAAFALVGYKFQPVAPDPEKSTPHWIYRLLCWVLFSSRLTLAVQYAVTTVILSRGKNKRLQLLKPLALQTAIFSAASMVFGGLYAGFPNKRSAIAGDIGAMYGMILVELFGTIGVSSVWRKLSFRATHVAERLGLLGLIIIGEGVIGTTKTTTRIMGRLGVYFEGCALIFAIILILMFMWTLYFDNLPRHRFGTIKQHFWMALHFPLHLAVLGVVEGAQHMALARYLYVCAEDFAAMTWRACVGSHLDGPRLAQNLTWNIEHFRLNESARGGEALHLVIEQIEFLGNLTGVCSPANTSNLNNGQYGVPIAFRDFLKRGISGMFQAFDLDIPQEGQMTYGFDVAAHSWIVVYAYFWSAIILLIVCLTCSSLLASTNRQHPLHLTSLRLIAVGTRTVMIVFSLIMLIVGLVSYEVMYKYLSSPWVLPTVVLQLFIVCLADRVS